MILVFWRDNIADPDCFYHTAHARVYWQHGPFYHAFPWAAHSIISQQRSDIWWGFHVALSPIGQIADPVLAMRVAIVIVVAAYVWLIGFAYSRFKLSPWWAFGSLAISAGFLSRAATVRPQVISAGLLPVIFAELWNRSIVGAAVAGAVLGFLHPTIGYLVFPVVLVTAFGPGRKKNKWPEVAVLVSLTLTAFLRPNVLGGAKLLMVQTFDLLIVKKMNIIQNFGSELAPANLGYFLYAAAVPLGLLVVGFLFVRKQTLRTPAWGLLLLTSVYAIIFFAITKRGVDQIAPFAFFSYVVIVGSWKRLPRIAPILALIACIISVVQYTRDKYDNVHTITHRFEGASEWLAENTPRGSIIYHTVWSHFADLFFWNRRNRYLGGMDPIFQYAVSPENYWLCTPIAHNRRPGWVGLTSPMKGVDIPLWLAAPKYLNSKWILSGVGPENPMIKALQLDKRHYALRYADKDSRVFEIIRTTD